MITTQHASLKQIKQSFLSIEPTFDAGYEQLILIFQDKLI